MRLLYFWCREDKNLEHEYNFIQGFRFAKTDQHVVRVEVSRSLADDFFSYSSRKDVVVSAMIGKNGSGKTTCARMLSSLALADKDGILVVDDGDGGKDGVLVYSNLDIEFSASDRKSAVLVEKLNDKGNRKALKSLAKAGLKFVYYSPLYSPQHSMSSDGSFFVDLSTTHLMKNPIVQVTTAGEGVQSWKRFEQEESNRVWEFIFKHVRESRKRLFCEGTFPELPEIPLIRGAHIGINERFVRAVERKYTDRLKELVADHTPSAMIRKRVGPMRSAVDDYRDTPGGEFCKEVCVFIKRCCAVENFFPRLVYAFVLSCWYDRGVGLVNEPNGTDRVLLQLMDVLSTDNESDLRHQIAAMIGGALEITDDEKSAWNYILEGVLRLSHGDCLLAKDGLSIRFKLTERDLFLNLVYGYSVLKGKENFLLFSEYPKVSSGEWAFIAMMSRFSHFFKWEGKRVVVFLDEAETTLHPEFQSKLVKNLILFFEAFMPGVRVHLILASHSPILLSDIPVGNVLFLDGCSENVTNTFGCNIFDLYHIPFEMSGGAIGKFAADKIEKVLAHIRRSADLGRNNVFLSKEERQIVELTGDVFLRDYFKRYADRGRNACAKDGL